MEQKDPTQLGSRVLPLEERAKRQTRTSSNASRARRRDVDSFEFSYAVGVDLLLQDRPCSGLVSGAFVRLLKSVSNARDWLGFIASCSEIRESLVAHGYWDTGLSKGHTRWVRGIRMAIEHAIEPSLIVHPSVEFNRVVTFLGWLKRLPVFIRDTTLSIDEYYENDARLSKVSIDPSENVYLPKLRSIWQEWFRDFEITSSFRPKHGSGSTADCGRVRDQKWRGLGSDLVERALLRNSRLERIHSSDRGFSRVASLVFVPKQAGKDRSICMEPATLQYLQQGIARDLIKYAEGRHNLSRYVRICSQEQNRTLCAQAIYKRYATIDLSNASDSVSWPLVQYLCGHLPLGRYLAGSRSRYTLIDGRVVAMTKFAPMGSALCFPIESYVFSSVVECAFQLHYGRASQGHRDGCSVYGDDIVCPAEIYHLIVDILTSLGFVVNEQKSFSSGHYYESCGVEYCRGVLIETIKHPRSHILPTDVVSPDQIGLVTDLANSLNDFGCFRARRRLLKAYENVNVRVGSKIVPFFSLVDFSSTGLRPIGDVYRKTHYSKALQCKVIRETRAEPVYDRAGSDYLQWLSDHPRRDRYTRLRDLYRQYHTVDVDPRFTRKGVILLSRYGLFDLLESGDVNAVGAVKTGPSRYRLVTKDKPIRE